MRGRCAQRGPVGDDELAHAIRADSPGSHSYGEISMESLVLICCRFAGVGTEPLI